MLQNITMLLYDSLQNYYLAMIWINVYFMHCSRMYRPLTIGIICSGVIACGRSSLKRLNNVSSLHQMQGSWPMTRMY